MIAISTPLLTATCTRSIEEKGQPKLDVKTDLMSWDQLAKTESGSYYIDGYVTTIGAEVYFVRNPNIGANEQLYKIYIPSFPFPLSSNQGFTRCRLDAVYTPGDGSAGPMITKIKSMSFD